MLTDGIHAIGWRPEIGDPTLAGWFTVFSYFLAAFLSVRVRSGLPKHGNPSHRAFWLLTGLLMLALGVNKQLDLQSLLTALGKYYAHRQGWYPHRQWLQMAFIASILCLGITALFYGFKRFRGILKENWLAFAGIVFLSVFVLIRASSFHHMDRLIGTRWLGMKMNWLLELSGIYCIVLNAFWLRRNKRRTKK